VAIAALTTAFGFAGGFQRLFSDPHLSGWNWGAAAGIPFTGDLSGRLVPALRSSPVVSGLSAVNDSVSVQLEGEHGEAARAALSIESAPGRGTRVVVEATRETA